MKTIQKRISMHYLIFGLIISLTTVGVSCDKKRVERSMTGDFYYVNDTDHTITYAMCGYEKYNLGPRSTILVKDFQESGKDVMLSQYISPMIKRLKEEGTFIIKFGNNKCWEAYHSVHSPLEIKNYISEKVDERTYKFTFTFTDSDYQRAIDCR